MGDFVKGRVDDGTPHPLRDGIMLHRRIDSFAEHHPLFLRSRQRLAPRYGLYRGVMVDLFYDHFLAVDWEELSPEPLDDWLVRMRMVVEVPSQPLARKAARTPAGDLRRTYPFIQGD